MTLTVEKVMMLEPINQGKIIAGHKGILNPVTSVSVLEVPKASPFLKKNEISITSFYSIAEDVDKQLDLIRVLKELSASGIILSHVGIYLSSVSDRLIDLCNELSFPLILAPSDVAYIDILSPILDSLLQTQNQKLSHAMRIYDQMTSLILDDKDINDLVNSLSRLITKNVYFYNFNNECVSSSDSCPSTENDIYIRQSIRDLQSTFIAESSNKSINSLDLSYTILLAPVVSQKMYYGVLVIIDPDDLKELDHVSIAQAKTAVAIISLNKINLKEYQVLIKHDFITDFINWNFDSKEKAIQRASGLGFDILKVKAVMIIDIYNFSELSKNYSEDQLQEIKNKFSATIRRELAYHAPDCSMISFSDKYLILYSSNKEKEVVRSNMKALGKHLRQIISSDHNIDVTVGIGRCYDDIADIKNSYNEALSVLSVSNRIFGKPRCTTYEEIEMYAYLNNFIEKPSMNTISQNLLSPVIRYDEENRSDLLKTLLMLIRYDANTKFVSEKMFVHKNTILQRKNKILELLEYDPFIAPYRQQIEIALYFDDQLTTLTT